MYIKLFAFVQGTVYFTFKFSVDMSVVQCTLDLFAAGTETTSTTLQWAMLYLSTQQNIQDKCHAEILEVGVIFMRMVYVACSEVKIKQN